MKLHKILVGAVVESLQHVFFEKKYADKVIEKTFKSNPKWGARDRAFIAENTYEIVRYWRLLAYVAEVTNKEQENIAKIVGTWFLHKGYEKSDWEGFDGLNYETIEERFLAVASKPAIHESVPDWLYELGKEEIGDQWDVELHALNKVSDVILRVNTLKTDLKTLHQDLAEEKVETRFLEDTPDALALTVRKNVFSTELFKKGNFEVQDAGSQWIGRMLDVQAGMRVIDACAGAGGKTLHLAALMENKGRIIAMDVEEYKLDELKKRARRAGVGNVETKLIEGTKTIKRLTETADRLLLDVPCSGLGVLRRNPDAKWKLAPDFIEKIQVTQRDILARYSRMLKKGGKMVYATCSVLPSESEDQVAWFLEENSGFQLLEEKRCSPAKDGYDGFYMACIVRTK
jgi:16S rRNA (cytosine967-C5)-methyltransferase